MKRSPILALSLISAALLAFAGCAAMQEELKLDPGAEEVRLLMSEQRNCKYLGEVTGHYVAREKYEETDEKARILLKNAALAKKANAVVLLSIDRRKDNVDVGYDEPASTKIVGSAYHCSF